MTASLPSGLPSHATGQWPQHLRAQIAKLCVRSVHVYATERPIRRLVTTGDSTGVHDWCCSRGTPRRVEIPVVIAATCGVDVDGAVVGVAHGRLDAVALLTHNSVWPDFIAPDSGRRIGGRPVALLRDRSARAAVAAVTANRAAVRKPCKRTAD